MTNRNSGKSWMWTQEKPEEEEDETGTRRGRTDRGRRRGIRGIGTGRESPNFYINGNFFYNDRSGKSSLMKSCCQPHR